MQLASYGKNIDVSEIRRKTRTEWIKVFGTPVGMTDPLSMMWVANSYGLRSRLLSGDLTRLKYFVARRRPVIILVRNGELLWHYVVVVGYDMESFYIADPATGREETIPEINLLSSWAFYTDLSGLEYNSGRGQIVCDILQKAGVQPYTMLVPGRSTIESSSIKE